ncbi:MAG TPA: dienelactone hydrolase family protein [Bradyrhizobium sp.]|nr:dienelactone hydrolase family protein [Bradyrhizobium sp.]
MISRRSVLGGLAVVAASCPLHAETPERLNVAASEGDVALTRYAAKGEGKRASVVVLHGARGVELHLRAYERYANALTARGIDAYMIHYYSPADDRALEKITTSGGRQAYQADRYDAWTARVSSAVAAILARPDSSGRLGLLGFSLGGFVAAVTAARDDRVAALAVLYGGMPEQIAPEVRHLPPLLELHGDADRTVPFARGEALVKLAKAAGGEAELVAYPGKAHGFDFSDSDPMAADAVDRVVRFFQSRLQAE